jgi:hypothetical protein
LQTNFLKANIAELIDGTASKMIPHSKNKLFVQKNTLTNQNLLFYWMIEVTKNTKISGI